MMRWTCNETEDDALQGRPLAAQLLYLRGLRRYMDYKTIKRGWLGCGGVSRGKGCRKRVYQFVGQKLPEVWVDVQG